MEHLPLELILIIFCFIDKITDKRQFLKICKTYNVITKNIFIKYEQKFIKEHFRTITDFCGKKFTLEKFTVEICHDGYFHLLTDIYFKNNKVIVDALAYHNNLELLKKAIDNSCKLTRSCCYNAAKNGNLDILKYIYSLETEHPLTRKNGDMLGDNICDIAAMNGFLDVLMWAREIGCPLDKFACAYAAGAGHLPIVQWLVANSCKINPEICSWAAQNGHMHVLKWAYANNCPIDYWTCTYAAEYGHLCVFEWLETLPEPLWIRENMRQYIHENICYLAAKNGHLNILEWLKKKSWSWSQNVCAAAAEGGHIDIIKWLISNKCELNEKTFAMAAKKGNMEILKLLKENSCP